MASRPQQYPVRTSGRPRHPPGPGPLPVQALSPSRTSPHRPPADSGADVSCHTRPVPHQRVPPRPGPLSSLGRPIATPSGAVVITVDNRLAPENPLPAALDDSYTVLTWAYEHAAEPGIEPDRGRRPQRRRQSRGHCDPVTSRARRSASSCSTRPPSTTGSRRGRRGTPPRRPGTRAPHAP
ncbi:alpha/beta hydrolase fold domain-containing protein [Streptomyces sp. NPDC045369]|uniref:alpha/beta hydrolase fold domain-containing protein n=1 Tax=Streptomyces sp. NPDC045369 TaxID=3155732 RepID=UPI0033CCAE0A